MLEKKLVGDNTLLLEFKEYMMIASTSLGGGLKKGRYIVIHSVRRERFAHEEAEDYRRRILRDLGIDDAPVMLTAVDVKKHVHVSSSSPEVHVIATVGLTNATCIDTDEVFEDPPVGTINIVVAVSKPLSEAALLDLLRTVVEAKAATAADLLLRCPSRATGTSSDAIAVASPIKRGERPLPWCGMNTKLGNKVAKLVRTAILKGSRGGCEDENEWLKRVIGLGFDDLLDACIRAYRKAPIPGVKEEAVREMLVEELRRVLRDPNVWALLVAAREADLHAKVGAIPGLSSNDYDEDSHRIVADEVLGVSLALYVAGLKGLFATYWVERLKNEELTVISGLPVFEDDVVSALVGSVLTRIYDRLVGAQR